MCGLAWWLNEPTNYSQAYHQPGFGVMSLYNLTFTVTRGSNGPKSFDKRLALLYYRHLNTKTSFYSSTNHFPFIINNEITIFDFSRFLFATLTFWVVTSRRRSNGPVYPIKRRSFFACYRVRKDPRMAEKGVKKTGVTRGSNGPIYEWRAWLL